LANSGEAGSAPGRAGGAGRRVSSTRVRGCSVWAERYPTATHAGGRQRWQQGAAAPASGRNAKQMSDGARLFGS
jgi:hypothetical protein